MDEDNQGKPNQEQLDALRRGSEYEYSVKQSNSDENFQENNTSTYVEPEREWNILAIIGFALTFIAPFIGIIVDIVALAQIKKNPSQRGKGLAIAGIIISILVILLPLLIFLFLIGIGPNFTVGSDTLTISQDSMYSEKCQSAPGLDCLYAPIIKKGYPGSVLFILRNQLGYGVEILDVEGGSCDIFSFTIANAADMVIDNGQTAPFTIKCREINDGKFSQNFKISYRNVISGLEDSFVVELEGKAS